MNQKTIKITYSDAGMSFNSNEEWTESELKAVAAAFVAYVAELCEDEEKSAEEQAKFICGCVMYAIQEGLIENVRIEEE